MCSAKELHHGLEARVLLSLVLLGLEIQLIPLSKPGLDVMMAWGALEPEKFPVEVHPNLWS